MLTSLGLYTTPEIELSIAEHTSIKGIRVNYLVSASTTFLTFAVNTMAS